MCSAVEGDPARQLEIMPCTVRTEMSSADTDVRRAAVVDADFPMMSMRSSVISDLASSRAMRALANWMTVAGDRGVL